MPVEIRELVVKITVEENRTQNEGSGVALTEIDTRVNKLEEQLAALTDKIEYIFNR